MYLSRFGTVLLLCVGTLMAGCVSVTNISHDPRYSTGYIVGAVYRFKEPVFAEKESTMFGNSSLILNPIACWGADTPNSIEEYEKNRRRFPKVAGIIKPGTLLKISSIQLEKSVELGEMVSIRARLLDGDFARYTAQLTFLSREQGGSLPILNTNILELVTKP